ncbi:OLC1v1015479C1 [Oldenlandia corymbosa var. corymbosa]|uniref:OLC1v1015479C1 n=1 Tax=Oldenlandia corymbosa var. corymbosa TaxID=529605 RepID=A0AAV1E6J0_OLDCO|nr:OLC1v1015479C1 [Oldenlandia corymbosa var. corymbosa]
MAPARASSSEYDYVMKILLIGDSGVGNSSLLESFSGGDSSSSSCTSFITTIGIDFKTRTVELDGRRVNLKIWDIAGQERFRTITSASYYRGAMGIVFVYDVTDESSFDDIRHWIRNIDEQHASSDKVCKILVGNKADVDETKRVVSTAQGQALADQYGIEFFETSTKTNANVEQVFFSIARDIKRRLHSEAMSKTEPSTTKFNQQPNRDVGQGEKAEEYLLGDVAYVPNVIFLELSFVGYTLIEDIERKMLRRR